MFVSVGDHAAQRTTVRQTDAPRVDTARQKRAKKKSTGTNMGICAGTGHSFFETFINLFFWKNLDETTILLVKLCLSISLDTKNFI